MLRLDSKQKLNWRRTERGYTAFVSLGVADLPLEYLRFDGKQLQKVTEIIDEQELFHKDSLETAFALPITLNHPKSGLFSQNADGLQVGTLLQEYRQDDKSLLVLAQVHDKRGVDLIDRAIAQQKKAEVSPGYHIDRLERSGNVFRQISRRYDHLALLEPGLGRGGADVCFRTDAIDLEPETAVSPTLFLFHTDSIDNPINKEKNTLYVLRLDSREFKTEDQELFNSVQALQSRADAADAAKATAEATVASLTGELEGTKAKLTEAENARLDSSALNQEIQLRLDTWAIVEPALRKDSKDFQRDNSLTVDEIRIAYLQKVAPDTLKRLDSADPNYSVFVAGLWEALKPQQRSDAADAVDATTSELEEIDNFQRTDSIDPGTDARKQAIAKLENAYKQ